MTLTEAQVTAYLDRLGVSQDVRSQLEEGPNGPSALEAVTKLQHRHLAAVPFENLDLIYSSHHSLPSDTDSVYNHVVNRKRGGVCDQIHMLFIKLLKHFGFVAYCTGSRINSAAGLLADPKADKTRVSYGPWVHLNTIVTIGHLNYIVDTSHGPSGSPFPVPLVHDKPSVDIWPRERRMIYSSIPNWTSPDQKWWRLQIRSPATKNEWMDVWAFTETEWLEIDFQMIRIAYTALGSGWVAPHAVCFQTLFEEEKPVGYLMLVGDEVRKNYKGNTEVVQKLYNESDRVSCLSEDFGITLTDEEQKEIIGMDAELKDEDFDYYS